MNHYTLREHLIDSQAIHPAADPARTLMPVRLPPGVAVLRLDDLGRAAAMRHMREGRFGAIEVRLIWDRRIARRPTVTR